MNEKTLENSSHQHELQHFLGMFVIPGYPGDVIRLIVASDEASATAKLQDYAVKYSESYAKGVQPIVRILETIK